MKVKKFLLVVVIIFVIMFAVYGKILQLIFSSMFDIDSRDSCLGTSNFIDSDVGIVAYNNSEIKNYDNFRIAYYANLINNFGYNHKGSCGYVALGMLLSYYDTYLNDNIIPEQYDKESKYKDKNFVDDGNSPGVRHKTTYEADNKRYYNELISLADTDLHSKLVTIGVSKNFCNIEKADYSTDIEQRNVVLETYLKDVVGYIKGNQYIFDYLEFEKSYYSNSDKVKNYIISRIKEGFPVLISVANVDGSKNHAGIAYEYNEDSGEIYCHMGEKDGVHVTISQRGFTYYKSAMVIDFNLPHSHSNNYSDGTNNYCYCSEEICVYKHNKKFENTDTSYHTVSCACGSINTTENHIYKNYTKIIGALGSLQHNANCACGASKTENHVWVAYDKNTLSLLGLAENFMVNPFAAGGTFKPMVQCKYCKYIKILKDDEFIPVPND